MFFKLSIIFVFVLASIIIIDANEIVMEKPIVERVTRGGRKFLGLFSVQKLSLRPYVNKNKRWRGDLFFTFGPHKIIATSVEVNHGVVRDPLCIFCLQHPQLFNTMVNHPPPLPSPHFENAIGQPDSPLPSVVYDALNISSDTPVINTKPSSVSVSATASLSTNTEAPKKALTMKPSAQREVLKTMKLEDYDVITYDPVSEESESDALNRVRRESGDFKEESNDEMESTTVESSALNTTKDTEGDSSNNHVATISPMLQLPHNPAQDFTTSTTTEQQQQLYPPSRNPHVQYISITNRPMSSYDFYPSQPDVFYHQNYFNSIPHCVLNYFRNKFAPIGYDNSAEWISPSNYHNQHQQQQQQQRYYQWK